MRTMLRVALLTGILAPLLMPTGKVAAAEPISIKALSQLPAIQSVSMDPSGKHLVALIPSPTNPNETALATWDTAKLPSAPRVITPSGQQGHMQFIAAFALKADKILAVARQEWTGNLGGCGEGKAVGSTETFVTKVYLTGDDQKHFQEAFASKQRSLGISRDTEVCMELAGTAALAATLPLDPNAVIVKRVSGTSLAVSYYRYNLNTGATKLLFHGDPESNPLLFDPHSGEMLARQDIQPAGGDFDSKIYLRNPKTGQLELQKPLSTKLSDRYTVDIAGVDDASGKYYVLTDLHSNTVEARLYDAASQKFDPEPVVSDKQYPIVALLFGDQPVNFNKVVGFVIGGPSPQTVYVAPELKSIQAGVEKAFPGQHISIKSYTNDFSKVLFNTEDASHPIAWHMLLDKTKLANIGSQRPGINPQLIGSERWVSYASRDGLTIQGILDLPAGWKTGDAPLPAVVLPHGGPWARDYMGWDVSGWVPLLTSRGYAVLRPQYRGSTGFGRRLWIAGDKQWGLKMSDDIDDGAAWLVAQGIAAKNRIAIFGYSYGGFAAVAADVRSPSPYQCAIAGAPVANLGRLATSWSDNRLQRILQGHTIQGMDPMQNTAKAHLPIMLFDGTRDVRTPPTIHAHPFYEAVKNRVPAQFHWIPNMPHSMPWYPSQMQKVDNLIVSYLTNDCFTHGQPVSAANAPANTP